MDGGDVGPSKEDDEARPVPTEWRDTLQAVVRAIAEGDYALSRQIPSVASPDSKTVEQMRGYLKAYGERLLPSLPDDAWATSECHWVGRRWELLIDLWTLESGPSDLVLFVFVYETGDGLRYEVDSLHVP